MSNIPDSNPLNDCQLATGDQPNNNQQDADPVLDSLDVPLIVDADVELDVASERIVAAVRLAAQFHAFTRGEIGVRITDDATIRQYNARHLLHDYETDVISFGYHQMVPLIEGEMIVSIDTARRRATELGWPVASELLLYVVHGTLHIAGMDDGQPQERAQMRMAEHTVLHDLGIHDINRFGADRTIGLDTHSSAEQS